MAIKSELISGFVHGPYGCPTVDIFGDKYRSFILICGGIGITPIVSILK